MCVPCAPALSATQWGTVNEPLFSLRPWWICRLVRSPFNWELRSQAPKFVTWPREKGTTVYSTSPSTPRMWSGWRCAEHLLQWAFICSGDICLNNNRANLDFSPVSYRWCLVQTYNKIYNVTCRETRSSPQSKWSIVEFCGQRCF